MKENVVKSFQEKEPEKKEIQPPTEDKKDNNIPNSSKTIRTSFIMDGSSPQKSEIIINRNSPMTQIKSIFSENIKRGQRTKSTHISKYVPLTPKIGLSEHQILNTKYFPSKANVCKGNCNSSKKFLIPSSPILEYFTVNNQDNNFMSFSLENGNPNCHGDKSLSNSQNEIYNCSPSEFFNRNSNGLNAEKNMEIFVMNQIEEEDDDKGDKYNEEEIYSFQIQNDNYKDEDNTILNKINQMKNKKHKDKSNINIIKENKNSKKNINKKNFDEMIKSNSENNILNIQETQEEFVNNQLLAQDLNSKYLEQNDNSDKNNILNIEIQKDKFDAKIEKCLENLDMNSPPCGFMINKEKEEIEINKLNINDKNMNNFLQSNNINSNLGYNNFDNFNYNLGINNNTNAKNEFPVNYGMNINCTNLNINNYTNLNNNFPPEHYFNCKNNMMNYFGNQNQINYVKNKNQNLMMNNIPYMNNFGDMNNNNNIMNNILNNNMMFNSFNQLNVPNQNPQIFMSNFMNQNNSNLMNQNMINNSMNSNQIYRNNKWNNFVPNNNINSGKKANISMEERKKKQRRLDSSYYVEKPLEFLAENFSILGRDQGACRYIQQLLDDDPTKVLAVLFTPVCKSILDIINDPFGNYLIQKIITLLNDAQLYEILKIISPSFFDICCDSHGTRVLQKLMEYSKAPKVKQYFFELIKPLITPLLKEINGTFVVQKFSEIYKEYSNEINDIIVEYSPVLSTNRHGCCVVQKYLSLKDEKMIPKLLDKLVENSLMLIIDQFGNYVIQSILLIGDKKYGNKLAEKIAENVVYYAKHKYSSNVVEKCFDYCDGKYLNNLMTNVQKKENICELILDEHGNYVVQKVVALSDIDKQKEMLKVIISVSEKLKNTQHGEKVLNKLMITYPFINNELLVSKNKE